MEAKDNVKALLKVLGKKKKSRPQMIAIATKNKTSFFQNKGEIKAF